MIEIDMRSQLATLIDGASKVLRAKRVADDPLADAWNQIRDNLEAAHVLMAKVINAANVAELVEVQPEYSDLSVYPEEELISLTCERVGRGAPRVRRMTLSPDDATKMWRRLGGQGEPNWLGNGFTINSPFGSVEIALDREQEPSTRRYFA